MTTGSQAQQTAVAAFDVDGTLTRRDNVVPFLLRAAGARLPLALLRHPSTLVRAGARWDRDRLKSLACSSLAGLPLEEIRAHGAAFAEEIGRRRLRPDTTARLRHHQALGHATVLVSASLDAYLEPLGDLLGVDGVLCTRLEVALGGRLTGSLAGPNCRGREKVVRLDVWLAETGRVDAELWAYGDSAGDDAMLARADHAVRVDRRSRLSGRGLARPH